jgi:hypothetical protein
MKRIALFSLLAIATTTAEDLTVGGTTYKSYRVTKVEPDGIRIEHADGAAKLKIEQLPPELVAKFKLDPAKAAEHREKVAASAASAAAEKTAKDEEAAAGEPSPSRARASMDKAAAAAEPAEAPAATEAPAADPAKPDPALSWDLTPPDPAAAQKGKTWGIAEVQEQLFDLDGKIIRVEVVVNSASTIEAIDATSARMFAGSIFRAKSNYEFIGFPKEAIPKMRTMLKSTTGKMLFWVRVEAENEWPYPQLWVVGRSLHAGGLGAKPKFLW